MDWVPPGFLFARARAISSFPALILDPSQARFRVRPPPLLWLAKEAARPPRIPLLPRSGGAEGNGSSTPSRRLLDHDKYSTMSAATPIALPISNNRLLDIEHNLVRFQRKDYRDNDRQKTMTLSADEFIGRFLIHVLPDGFQRIRYYRFLSNCHRNEKLALCRQLLGMPAADPETLPRDQLSDYEYEALYEKLTGCSLQQCPICRPRPNGRC